MSNTSPQNLSTMDQMAIIQCVRPHPFLYDRRIKSSQTEKTDKWTEIGAIFNLTGYQIHNKWKSIKDKYILLKRRAEAYPGTVAGRQIESYKFADALAFLDDTIPPYNGLPPKNRIYKYARLNKSWNKEHTLLVIKHLSKHPLLYDKAHPHYNHCHQRMAAYRKIAEVVKRYNPQVTPEMISKKIRTIRTQFGKEKRDQKRKKQIPGIPYVPKLWFYNRLKFLDETKSYETNNISDDVSANTNEMQGPLGNFEQKFEEVDDYDRDGDLDEYEDENEDFNDVDEWISSRDDSTRPFEEVELKQIPFNFADDDERDDLDCEVEEVFDHSEGKGDVRNQTRNELYVKCTGLLESLAKQMKPLKGGGNTESKECNCKNSTPSSLLGKMIESELENVSERIYVDAKWKIIRILEEAQKKSLREKHEEM